ncbi:MAG: hypothetical protein ACKOPS_18730, partial [Cyanobium sp.]
LWAIFSELGILSGDSYLEISQRPAAEVVERICERLALQGVMVPRELPQQPGGELAVEEERTPSRWRHLPGAGPAPGLAAQQRLAGPGPAGSGRSGLWRL